VHGYDIARAAGRPWRIEPAHAAMVLGGFIGPAIQGLHTQALVNDDKAAGVRVTYDLRIRGGDPVLSPLLRGWALLCECNEVRLSYRASSARQKKDDTIASQTAALRAHAGQLGVELAEEWVFEDEGHSGATLIRPALERLRDVVAGVGVDVVLCYSPDRLARKFAYQALLIEEFARAGTRVEFVKGPRGDSPEDQLLVGVPGHVRRVREGADPGTLPPWQGPP